MSETFIPANKCVKVEFDDGIAWVTLNRPEKRNAMSPTLNNEMIEALTALEMDDRCKVLVLTGAGDVVLGRHGPEGILPRIRQAAARERAQIVRAGASLAVAPADGLPEADHRDGQWLVLRRRVQPAGRLRPRRRGRRGDVRPVARSTGASSRPATCSKNVSCR